MTKANKLKQAARARAAKTGESYATARQHVVAKLDQQRTTATQQAAAKARDANANGTVTEARCVENTGQGFDHWFAVLDRFGAPKKGHTAAAKHLRVDHGVSAWYAQSITVSYERARGLRSVNQSCAGDFQVSVSRVLPVSLATATAAFARKRNAWLPPDALTALAGKKIDRKPKASVVRFEASGGRVELRIDAKEERCTIVATVTKLADGGAVDSARATWRQALDALRSSLSGDG